MKESIKNILITVDVQNDFVDGSLAVNDGEHVVEPLNQLAQHVRDSMGRVAFTRDWHPSTTPHFETWPVHCVADTRGAEFYPTLDIQEEDVILSKGMGQTDGYSGAEAISRDGETLESIITTYEKVRVFIGGLATDYCVKATAIDIAKSVDDDVRIYAIKDAMRAVNISPDDDENAIKEMQSAGVEMLSLDDAIAMIVEQ